MESLKAQYTMLLVETLRAILSSKASEIRTASKTIDARYLLIDTYFEKPLTTESSAILSNGINRTLFFSRSWRRIRTVWVKSSSGRRIPRRKSKSGSYIKTSSV